MAMSRLFAVTVATLIGGTAGCHVVFSSDGSKDAQADANSDAIVDATFDGAVDAMDVAPNYAFITSMVYTSGFGGGDGANKICKDAASQVTSGTWPLPDSFIAVLGITGAMPSNPYNALELLRGSRGWIRPDGAFVADQFTDFKDNALRNALILNQNNIRTNATIWTGLNNDGTPAPTNCNGFSITQLTGITGTIGNPELRNQTLNAGTSGCGATVMRGLLCVSTGRIASVRPLPRPNNSRRIFLSNGTRTGASRRASFDQTCRDEAQAAGLMSAANSFVAFLPSTTASALSIADLTPSTVFTRVDGSPIGTLAGAAPLTFINQFANGTIVPTNLSQPVWTGARPNEAATGASNCADWADQTSLGSGIVGNAHSATTTAFVDGSALSCSVARRFYCVEK